MPPSILAILLFHSGSTYEFDDAIFDCANSAQSADTYFDSPDCSLFSPSVCRHSRETAFTCPCIMHKRKVRGQAAAFRHMSQATVRHLHRQPSRGMSCTVLPPETLSIPIILYVYGEITAYRGGIGAGSI